MKWIIRAGFGIVVLAAVAAWTSNAQCGDPAQWQSRTDLEQHARALDHRVIELQHDLMAARHNGDPDGMARAETELKKVQADRIETLSALGELR